MRARAPKIISTPELLDRWVGGSEKLVRSLFAEAEAELTAVGGDVRKSALHVIGKLIILVHVSKKYVLK